MLFSFLLLFAIFLPEVFFYHGVLENNIGIRPRFIAAALFGFLLALRLFTKTQLGQKFSAFYLFLFAPVFLSFAVGLEFAELYFYRNIVFGHTHIFPYSVGDVALFVALFSLVFLDFSLFRKYPKIAVFSLAAFFYALFVFARWRMPEFFYYLDSEDSVLEYTTFLFYLLPGLLALHAAWFLRSKKMPFYLKIFWIVQLLVSAIGLLFVAGEEISWGQRLLGLETPDSLMRENQQQELNLHNHSSVFIYVYYGYLALGIYGCVSWILRYVPLKIKKFKLEDIFRPVLSRWYLFPYFLVMVVYILWRYTSLDGSFDRWEETAELFMSFGVFLIFLISYREIRRVKASGRLDT